MNSSSSLRIIVCGYIVRGPLGGMAWHHLQYVQALIQMGHEVLYVEDSDDYPSCFNPVNCTTTTDCSFGLNFTQACFKKLNLPQNWAYYDAASARWLGPAAQTCLASITDADLFINLSGLAPARDWFSAIDTRVYVDTDPAFTQIKMATNTQRYSHACWHTHFFTFAENIHSTDCTIPTLDLPWQPTRQPVVMSNWSQEDVPSASVNKTDHNLMFSTVMQWNSYEPVTWESTTYGMKSEVFPDYFELPDLVASQSYKQPSNISLCVAAGGELVPTELLTNYGWKLEQSLKVTETLSHYQDFIYRSAAEFSVAKHGYVESRSGWFSERSANYLASGRPVVVQDTGFSAILPNGEGILSFSSPSEAVEAIQNVAQNYDKHSKAAKEIVAEEFSPELTLTPLLNTVFHQTSHRANNKQPDLPPSVRHVEIENTAPYQRRAG